MLDTTPTYNLGAVLRETGLKADTLRAWERRYGLPRPARSLGGHRLYSQRDIETLKWFVARQGQGLSISRAVALWRQLENEGQDPLLEPAYALVDTRMSPIGARAETLDELRQAWLASCLAFDEAEAEQVLASAFALYPVETVCFEILLHSLATAGDKWYRGHITVQQEHFVSELSVRRVEAVLSATPPPTRAGRIIVGCAPEDSHTFVPLLLTLLLRQRGWEVIYFGARVPADRLAETVAEVKPHLAILTAQQLGSAATLTDVADALQVTRVPLAYGGRIFNLQPNLRKRVTGHFLGERIETAPALVEQLQHSRSLPTPAVDVPDGYRQALGVFRERQMLIESETWRRQEASGILPDHLAIANEVLGRSIGAALRLGDIGLLRTDIEWIAGLLANYRMPTELLHQYLRTYREVAKALLGEQCAEVVGGLERIELQAVHETE